MLAIGFYGVGLVGLLAMLVMSVEEMYYGDDMYSGRAYMELQLVMWAGFLAGMALTGDSWGFTSLLGLALLSLWLAHKVYIPKGLHF